LPRGRANLTARLPKASVSVGLRPRRSSPPSLRRGSLGYPRSPQSFMSRRTGLRRASGPGSCAPAGLPRFGLAGPTAPFFISAQMLELALALPRKSAGPKTAQHPQGGIRMSNWRSLALVSTAWGHCGDPTPAPDPPIVEAGSFISAEIRPIVP